MVSSEFSVPLPIPRSSEGGLLLYVFREQVLIINDVCRSA